ncbi:hypothetical protein E2C01_034454 [Portunus trituberculatus]|uniref:Uncharacterized protein n=1 Tax=Portunus trituberculatus TaxID=210409 RepID=A0A5B7F0N7_PORTR|nr:hypothetical protein [Portunus trituberculatus]
MSPERPVVVTGWGEVGKVAFTSVRGRGVGGERNAICVIKWTGLKVGRDPSEASDTQGFNEEIGGLSSWFILAPICEVMCSTEASPEPRGS